MQKKILASLVIIGLLTLTMGLGTYAYFSDKQTSLDNLGMAGTIDIKLSNNNITYTQNVTATWSAPNWAPGDTCTSILYGRNFGTTGALMGHWFPTNLRETDANSGSTDIADWIKITLIDYTEDGHWMGYNLTSYYHGIFGDGTGVFTLREFVTSIYCMVTWTGGYPPAGPDYFEASQGNTEALKITFEFMTSAGNDLMGDTVLFDLEVTGTDDPSMLGHGSGYGYIG